MLKKIFVLLCFFASQYSIGAQQPSNNVAKSALCNSDFAKLLVNQQAAESKAVVETDKRINILIRSANLIWKYDQQTGRDYFAEAYKVATDRFNEKGFEKRTEKGLVISAPDYRFEVISAIAVKDEAWAKKLIDQILSEYEKAAEKRDNRFDRGREIGSTMAIATASINTNPDLSWYLFRRLMTKPLDYHWYAALYSIAKKDRRFSDQLYGELLRTYAYQRPSRFLFLSAYPFANDRILGIDKFLFSAAKPTDLAANPALQRQFVVALLQNFAAFASDPANLNLPGDEKSQPEPVYMISALQELQPIVVEQFPQLIQRFTEVRAMVTAMLSDEMRKSIDERERQNLELGYGFEERLKQIEKAYEEGKLTDYMIVSLVTWNGHDLTEEQFKRILPWLDKIKEKKVAEEVTNYFWFLRTQRAVQDKRLDDAEKYAAKVPEIEHRAMLIFEIAEAKIKDESDPIGSDQLLRDVSKMTRQMDNSVAKARVLFGLASIYEKTNHNFAIDELSDAVKVVNRLENPDILSSAVTRQIQGEKFSFFAIFSVPSYSLESTFNLLSKNDLDMTLLNARALEDKYLQTLAVFAVAQNCIDKPKTPKRKAK